MAVAKSYEKYCIIGEPFYQNGKAYIRARSPKGIEKVIRYYTDTEYAKMYGKSSTEPLPAQKVALGFGKMGFIWIFKGYQEEENIKEWFGLDSEARWAKWWGWYYPGELDVWTKNIPVGVEPVKLPWELVGTESGVLKREGDVRAAVNVAINKETGASDYVGEVGQRLDMVITTERNYEITTAYGDAHLMIMKDLLGNNFAWISKKGNWQVGLVKHIRGTVTKHEEYNGMKFTYLNRCIEVEG